MVAVALLFLGAGCSSQQDITSSDPSDENEAVTDATDRLAINKACTNTDRVDQPGVQYSTKEVKVSSDGTSSITTKGKVKTYKNSTYGFSFDYPCNWQLSGNREVAKNALNQEIKSVSLSLMSQATDCGAGVYAGTSPVPKGPSGPEFTVTDVLVNGNKFKKSIFKDSDGEDYQMWYSLDLPGKFYVFTDPGYNMECVEYVAKTFQLLK